jgi:hypothetical protein
VQSSKPERFQRRSATHTSDTRREAGEKVTSAFAKHVARHRVVQRVTESSGLNRSAAGRFSKISDRWHRRTPQHAIGIPVTVLLAVDSCREHCRAGLSRRSRHNFGLAAEMRFDAVMVRREAVLYVHRTARVRLPTSILR